MVLCGTDEVLDDAARRAITSGHTPRVLLLTSPSNPLGTTYSADQLRRMISWCKRNNIHLVSDEIYALSDRIVTLYEGRVTGEYPPDAPAEDVGRGMLGHASTETAG